MSNFIDPQILELKSRAAEIIKELHTLTYECRLEDLAEKVEDLRDRAEEPFLFVIAGEVKTGKSSFINALLDTGQDICAVAPEPMTDKIQFISYGEKKREETINPYLSKVYVDEPLLKDIAIVDTPGTNTIIEHHQEITERFIPGADLIVFVFEAKNPYRQSAWDLIKYINKEWHKNMIFVLQQKDLVTDQELAANHKGLKEQAEKFDLQEVPVFAVSAKMAQEGLNDSGIGEVEEYIRDNITGTNAIALKIINITESAGVISDKILDGVEARKVRLQKDQAFYAKINKSIALHSEQAYKQAELLSEALTGSYLRISDKYKRELESEINFFSILTRSFKSIFNKDENLKSWLKDWSDRFENELKNSLRDRIDDHLKDLVDSIQILITDVEEKITSHPTEWQSDQDMFKNITEQRYKILEEVQERFRRFLQEQRKIEREYISENDDNLPAQLVTGSGLVVIGIALAAITKGAVLDITGGILTAIGLLFAGITLGFKKRKILRQFQKEIDEGRERMRTRVSEQIESYIDNIKLKLDSVFKPFEDFIEKEQNILKELEERIDKIREKLIVYTKKAKSQLS